jgi:hypothetical protein
MEFDWFVRKPWTLVAQLPGEICHSPRFNFVYDYGDGTELRLYDDRLVRTDCADPGRAEGGLVLPQNCSDWCLLSQVSEDAVGLHVFLVGREANERMRLLRLNLWPLNYRLGPLLPEGAVHPFSETPDAPIVLSQTGLWIAGADGSNFKSLWRASVDPVSMQLQVTFAYLRPREEEFVIRHVGDDGELFFQTLDECDDYQMPNSFLRHWSRTGSIALVPLPQEVSHFGYLQFSSRNSVSGETVAFAHDPFQSVVHAMVFRRGKFISIRTVPKPLRFDHFLDLAVEPSNLFGQIATASGNPRWDQLADKITSYLECEVRHSHDLSRVWFLSGRSRYELQIVRPDWSLVTRTAYYLAKTGVFLDRLSLPAEILDLVRVFAQ